MGFFSGVDQRSGLDSGREKFFFGDVETKNVETKKQQAENLHLAVAPAIAIDRAWSN